MTGGLGDRRPLESLRFWRHGFERLVILPVAAHGNAENCPSRTHVRSSFGVFTGRILTKLMHTNVAA